MSLTLDLFAEPAPAPVIATVTAEDVAAAFGKFVGVCEEEQAFQRLEDQWPHVFAFVAQARHAGSTDPSLAPVQVSAAGRREFDMDELARFANELLRGVRSIRPAMTPERWGEAIQRVREIGGKS